MKGDFTRDTFDRFNHYTRVLMQQGRVQLDADWNEQTSIVQYYLQTLASDILGPHGGPKDNSGFKIIVTEADLQGQTDRWENPLSDERINALKSKLEGRDFVIGKGRYYVNGVLCENDEPIAYSEQIGYPFADESLLKTLSNTKVLVYLDAWERHVSFVEADSIREVALGGPDTATRAQRVIQVKVLPVDDNAQPDDLIKSLPRLRKARLRARAKSPDTQLDACIVNPQARFRGAENQLYRIEIHRGGSARSGETHTGGATFKWSRENGSVIFPVISATPGPTENTTSVILATLGRDGILGLQVGDRVELIDDGYTLQQRADPLLKVHKIEPDELRITLEGTPAYTISNDPERHPLLRRWDHDGDPGDDTDDGALLVKQSDNDWIDIEDGVQIQFPTTSGEQDDYRTGDHWLVPARTATADVDWPKHKVNGNSVASPLPPRGIVHDYAPLALVGINDKGQLDIGTFKDLRRFFEFLAKS